MRIIALFILILSLAADISAESISDMNIPAIKKPARLQWGRDPFIKYGQKDEKQAEAKQPDIIRIGGILSDGTRSVAIINGNFYRVGSSVEGYRIMDISSERVLFEKNGKKYYYGIEKFALEGGKK